jgi:hypothetical protein
MAAFLVVAASHRRFRAMWSCQSVPILTHPGGKLKKIKSAPSSSAVRSSREQRFFFLFCIWIHPTLGRIGTGESMACASTKRFRIQGEGTADVRSLWLHCTACRLQLQIWSGVHMFFNQLWEIELLVCLLVLNSSLSSLLNTYRQCKNNKYGNIK